MGCFDLQVNGYAGVDFNGDDWTLEELERACERLRHDGVDAILATIITDTLEQMEQRLARLVRARHESSIVAERIAGFHLEGPFLLETPGYIGAHPAHAARWADREAMERLLVAADGLTRIVTLAPERDRGLRVTRYLADHAIIVSAGHCNPSRDELQAAIDAGLSMVTHLGNGCPLQLPRHDNIIQRVLHFSKHLAIGFIGDGVHVPFFALGNYLRAAGCERAFIVTDAIAAAGQGPGEYQLGGQTVVVDEQLATWSADRTHLMGSASTMPRLIDNLRRELGFSAAEIAQLVEHNPRRAIGVASADDRRSHDYP